MTNPNENWEGAVDMHKALKALATSARPISASRVKTAAATALDNVKVGIAESLESNVLLSFADISIPLQAK